MRTPILLICLLISLSSFSQISTVEPDDKSNIIGQIALFDSTGINGTATFKKSIIENGNQYYILVWQNQEYTTLTDIVSIMFYATPEELDSLFDTFKTVFKTGKEQILNLGDNRLSVSKVTSRMLMFSTPEGYFGCNAPALHMLFGKPYDKKQWKSFLKS